MKRRSRYKVSKRSKLKKAILIAYVFLTLFTSVRYYDLWYGSPDAKYTRDNFGYLISRLEELNLLDSSDYHIYKWLGYPVVLQHLIILETKWTDSYLATVNFVENQTGKYILSGETNPYDTLSRLVLHANSENVQKLYECIQYDAVILNPNQQYNYTRTWITGRNEYQQEAYSAIENLLSKYFATTCLQAVIYGIWLAYGTRKMIQFCSYHFFS